MTFRLDPLLSYLEEKSKEEMPPNIRGRVMEHLQHSSPSYLVTTSSDLFYVGQDKTSCTSTTAAIYYYLITHPPWLENRNIKALTLSDIPNNNNNKRSFQSLYESTFLDETCVWLYTFHTPHHKFSVLRQGEKSCVLQSNQDDFTTEETTKYTFEEYLTTQRERFVCFNTKKELQMFFNDLQDAREYSDRCRDIYYMYFGVRWSHIPSFYS